MAYSMFERPKLHNARSLKFYPEEYDHHVSFRHKNLPPDFELTLDDCHHHHIRPQNQDSDISVQPQSSTHKKCPIYIHNFNQASLNEGDFVSRKPKKFTSKQRSVMAKLEETYWANWKPDTNSKKTRSPTVKNSKSPEIKVIKSAPSRRRKIQVFPDPEISKEESKDAVLKISSRSQEIQTDEFLEEKKNEETVVEKPEESLQKLEVVSEEVEEEKFLKHTDSFILNLKKQQEEKEHFEQPKCIRLYKKPGKITSKNFIKGGSYPLKSCLKKDSSFAKTNSRLNRPKSPLIVSSSFNTKNKYSKSHRH